MTRMRACTGRQLEHSTIDCGMMATIQVVIDDDLLRRLDCELQGAQRGRSALIRRAIEQELDRLQTQRLEEQHERSYREQPFTAAETEELRAWSHLSSRVLADDPWEQPRS